LIGAALLLSGAERASADDSIPTAWQLQAGTAGLLTAPPPPEPATICIIDTGVTPTPDLTITARSSTLPGTLDDVTAKPGQPGHGTTVAHFAAAAVNGWGGSGAFPHARISSVRVFPEEGGTTWEAYISALDRCQHIDRGTKVVVMSLGGQDASPAEAAELTNRIERVRRTYGLSVVTAAGNGGGAVDFPGRLSVAITVAAVDESGSLCPFSARGNGVDIAAPGCDLTQSGWDGNQWQFRGSSFSAPMVAGLLAALRSHRPDLSVDEAEALVLRTTRPGAVPLLDAGATLKQAGLEHLIEGMEQQASADPPRSSQPASEMSFAVGSTEPPAPERSSPGLSRVVGRPHAAIPLPRGTLRRIGRRSFSVRVSNRPSSAYLEVSSGRERVKSRRSRIRVRANGRNALRVRFVEGLRSSRWVSLRIKHR